jgi:hypothetical protein
MSQLYALRAWGLGAALALVSAVPIVPSVNWNPPWFAGDADHNPGLSSVKNSTGEPE